MVITWFAPFFVLATLFACTSAKRWFTATVALSVFQAASPILLTVGGRFSGIQSSYALLPVGLMHLVTQVLEARSSRLPFRWSTPHLLLLAVTVIGVGGAFLLPKLFNGSVYVTTAAGHYARHILHSGGGNAIQAFYLICNLLLFSLITIFLQREICTITECMKSLEFGTCLAATLGVYQIFCDRLHLPWPDVVINSNLGQFQNFDQAVYGVPKLMGATRRMSATFLEPSMMAMYFLGMFSLFALGLNRWKIGSLILFCLLVSTSATALVGLVLIFGIWLVWELPKGGMDIRKTCAVSLAISVIALGALILAMEPSYWGKSNLIMQKLSSSSGQSRIGLDRIAIQTLLDTWGLGVGVGSTRSSSFAITFAACTGIPGVIALLGFVGIVIFSSVTSSEREFRALGLAFATIIAAWLISVPDLAVPIVWIVSAAACSSKYKSVERGVQVGTEAPFGTPASY